MIAYIDSSVILRMVLGQPQRLREWSRIDNAVASVLVEVECLRTLDRLRLRASLHDEALSARRAAVYDVMSRIDVVEITRPVLERATLPLPTVVGTLDAIHLATAQLWREDAEHELVIATHDVALAVAARAVGFRVVGVEST